jgi:hypothetical protein
VSLLGAYVVTEAILIVALLGQVVFSRAADALRKGDHEQTPGLWDRAGLRSRRSRVIAVWVVFVLPMVVLLVAAILSPELSLSF